MSQAPFIWPDFLNFGVAPPVERGASALSLVVGARAFNSILDNMPSRYALPSDSGMLDGVYAYFIGPIYNAEPFDMPMPTPLLPNPYAP